MNVATHGSKGVCKGLKYETTNLYFDLMLMKNALAVAFLTFAAHSLLAATPPKGFLIYSEPPSTYADSCEYSSVNKGPLYSIVLRPDGKSLQFERNAILTFVDYPTQNPEQDTQDVAAAKLKSIQETMGRYPQFKVRLQAIQTKWENALTAAKQLSSTRDKTDVQVSKTETTTIDPTAVFITLDGHKYPTTNITHVDPDGLTVMTDSGIQKLTFASLPKDIQQKYNYDPKKAAEFSQLVAKAQQERIEHTRAIQEQQQAAERAEAQSAPKVNETKVVAQRNTGLLVKAERMTVDQIGEAPFTLRGYAVEVVQIQSVDKQEVASGVYHVTLWGHEKMLNVEMTADQCDSVVNTKRLFIRVKEQESYSGNVPVEALGNAVTYQGLSRQPTFYWK